MHDTIDTEMPATPIFDYTTTGMVPTAKPRPLPLEVLLLIIDELGADREYDALEAWAEASEGLLQERAYRYIPREIVFGTQEEAASINLAFRWKGPQAVRIEGGARTSERRLPIPHLATFASRLAGKWTNVRELTIEGAEWRMQDLDLHTILLDVGCFDRVLYLQLHRVTLPTVLTLWRLVHGLPSLHELSLRDVEFAKTAINDRMLSALCLLPSTLNTIYMLRPEERAVERPGLLGIGSAGLLQAIVVRSMTSLNVSPWCKVSRLELWDVTFPTAAAFGRLLCAVPTLKELAILGPCSFSERVLDPRDVPVIPCRLRELELGEDFSAHSNPRLIACAGQSLQSLELYAVLQDSLRLYNETRIYAEQSSVRCFDISANTHLERLTCVTNISHEDNSPIAAVTELLQQVASVRISEIDMTFRVRDEAELATLWNGLPQLDAALSKKMFDRLERAWIRLYGVEAFPEIVRSYLPKLETRGILRIAVKDRFIRYDTH
ncbi:hypothetical protein IEO21_10086 [Rhodonia placenta]|uniref:F-box domain-containing protein n=1 Tax=Rhodonia placenta TaxID=104341 RepID=A0A8H7TXM2_9APHY|nr:hypothetical protein IEO21_10086 [Postia placenta]